MTYIKKELRKENFNLRKLKSFEIFKQAFKYNNGSINYFDRKEYGFRLNMINIRICAKFDKDLFIKEMNKILEPYGLYISEIELDRKAYSTCGSIVHSTYIFLKYIIPPKRTKNHLNIWKKHVSQISEILDLQEEKILKEKDIKVLNLKNEKLIYFYVRFFKETDIIPIYDNIENKKLELINYISKNIIHDLNLEQTRYKIIFDYNEEHLNNVSFKFYFKK